MLLFAHQVALSVKDHERGAGDAAVGQTNKELCAFHRLDDVETDVAVACHQLSIPIDGEDVIRETLLLPGIDRKHEAGLPELVHSLRELRLVTPAITLRSADGDEAEDRDE